MGPTRKVTTVGTLVLLAWWEGGDEMLAYAGTVVSLLMVLEDRALFMLATAYPSQARPPGVLTGHVQSSLSSSDAHSQAETS